MGTTTPNPFSVLADEEVAPEGAIDVPPPRPPRPNAAAHGWDSFLDSLEDKVKDGLGTVDELLINYANFAGDEFRAFDRASARSDARLTALEARLEEDIDDILENSVTISDLKTLAMANVQGLATLRTLVTETTHSINAVSQKWDLMSSQVAEVKETAETAFRLASQASPTIAGQGLRLDGLFDDVSRMSSDIDSLRASVKPPQDTSSKMATLEETVIRMGEEVESIRALLADKPSVQASGGESRTAHTEASTAVTEEDRTQRQFPPEQEPMPHAQDLRTEPRANTRHPMFPNADPAYSRPRVPVANPYARSRTFDSGGNTDRIVQVANPYARPSMDSARPPFGDGENGDAGRTEDIVEDTDEQGGRIISPRNADRRRLAFAAKISPLDVARLGNVRYHGGVKGYYPLTMQIVHRCGYTELNSTDVILNHNDIIRVHTTVWENWEHPRGHTRGPQLDKILEKGLASFPRLATVDVESSVEFYDSFHKTALLYLLPVVPFDCISIIMGFEALCPPGLGLQKYAAIAGVLMELLPRLLPRSDTQVTSLVRMVRAESGNGYDLLWRIMALSVPGFDPSIQVKIPVWQDDDIFDFALSFLLYFRLQAKRGVVQDDRTHSLTFLNAIAEPAYADTVTTLLTCITNYPTDMDDGYLPTHLCVMGLASQINNNARSRAVTVIPKVHRTIAMGDWWDRRVTIQGSPMVARLDAREGGRPPPRYNGRGTPRDFSRDAPRPGGSRPVVQGGRDAVRQGFPQTSKGRYARPDRNGGELSPSTICDACRRTGHVAANCDVLAIALFIEKYKKDLPADTKDRIESDWITRWKSALGNPHRKPRRVMKAYLDLMDITMDDLDEQMCWDCWPEDDVDVDIVLPTSA